MTFEQLIAGVEKYGSGRDVICQSTIGVAPEQIGENVILAPWWEPDTLPSLGRAACLSASGRSPIKVWAIEDGGLTYTYIKTGIGAPVLADVVLALGVTDCKRIVFIGSVGALSPEIGIGEIVIPEHSVCGDGASRYIRSASLANGDIFGEKVYPDGAMLAKAKAATERVCAENNVRWHIGRNFSTDTVLAQFAHLDEIIGMGCNVIEMETAAAFAAAAVAGIALAAVFSVSDNSVLHKSLVSGRTESDQAYRQSVRRKLFPEIIRRIFQ